MSTPVISPAVADSPTANYLAAVEAALADLPAPERAELLDDVRQHLAEVAAETGESLEATLGEPAAYADDLRAAAGLPPAVTPIGTRASTPGAWARAAAHPVTLASLAFLRTLRPGWWVLRGMVLAGSFWLPRFTERALLGHPHPLLTRLGVLLPTMAVAVAASIWLGFFIRGRALPWRLIGVAVNISVLWVGLAAAVDLGHAALDTRYVESAPTYVTPPEPAAPASLSGPDGLIYNIYPYDAQGRQLTGVQLFDQNGNPINIQVGQDPQGRPLTRQVPVSSDGHALDNVFPQTQLVSGSTPAPAPSAPAAIGTATAVVPPGPGSPQPVILPGGPAAAASATAAPTPTTSPGPAASATPVASPSK